MEAEDNPDRIGGRMVWEGRPKQRAHTTGRRGRKEVQAGRCLQYHVMLQENTEKRGFMQMSALSLQSSLTPESAAFVNRRIKTLTYTTLLLIATSCLMSSVAYILIVSK